MLAWLHETTACCLFLGVAPRIGIPLIAKQLRIEGFMGWSYIARWPQAFLEMDKWIQEVCV